MGEKVRWYPGSTKTSHPWGGKVTQRPGSLKRKVAEARDHHARK